MMTGPSLVRYNTASLVSTSNDKLKKTKKSTDRKTTPTGVHQSTTIFHSIH